jgi:cob(I)alamin adenosyltransferase
MAKKVVSVSTKTGDKGTSGLANGQRIPKDNLVFEVLGTLDELSSWIGLIITKLDDHFFTHKTFLLTTQENLFHLGAELALSPKTRLSPHALRTLESRSEKLQQQMSANWTTLFIYPGGSESAAYVDITRTVCRRLERVIVQLNNHQEVRPVSLKYINRLSDYLYVLRCFVNQELGKVDKKFVAHHTLIKATKS